MAISILVVDDSPMARKMLIKALPVQWNVKITQAGNGKEAIAEFRAGNVDLMFLDLTMPEMDGYQTLEAVRNEGLKCVEVSPHPKGCYPTRLIGLWAGHPIFMPRCL